MAVNTEDKGSGAVAVFTASVGGTYTLTVSEEYAIVNVVDATGHRTQVLKGAGTYQFHLEGGEDIEFFLQTEDEKPASVSLLLELGV